MLSKRYLYCAHAQVHLRLLLASKSVLPVPAKFDFRVRVQCKDHFFPNNYNFNRISQIFFLNRNNDACMLVRGAGYKNR